MQAKNTRVGEGRGGGEGREEGAEGRGGEEGGGGGGGKPQVGVSRGTAGVRRSLIRGLMVWRRGRGRIFVS